MKSRKLFISILLIGALTAGVFVARALTRPSEPRSAFIIPMPSTIPDFSLVDQIGAEVTADTFRGQWDLVFFGFTHCPDICPTTLQTLASVKRDLIEAGAHTLPRIVLVSVDPERDTPELLGQYMDYFGEGHLAVTGEIEEVTRLTDALGIYFEKIPGEDGSYSVNHSAAVLLIGPNAEFSALFSAPHRVADYLHDLPIVMGDQ